MTASTYFFAFVLLLTASSASAQNVGIGVAQPTEALSVAKGINLDHHNENTGTNLTNGLRFGHTTNSGQMVGIGSNRSGVSPLYTLDFYTANTRRMTILGSGQVGIGTAVPNYTLDVAGSIRALYNLRADGDLYASTAYMTGSVNASNNVNAVNSITATNGDIKATNGELSAGGKGVLMNNGAGRMKYTVFTATLSVNSLAPGESRVGHISYGANTFTALPTAYVGNVLTPNGDYYKAMLV